MKKSLVGLALVGSMMAAGQANALTVATNASYSLFSGQTLNFTETTSEQYYGLFSATYDATFDIAVSAGNMVFTLFTDSDGVFNGSATFNGNNFVPPQFNLSAGQTASVTLLAGVNYVLRIVGDATPDGGAATTVSSVPVPAAAWLFGSALFGAGALRRKSGAVASA